jgi:hypothetical protein
MNEEWATIHVDKYTSLRHMVLFFGSCQETWLIGGREMYIQNFCGETC